MNKKQAWWYWIVLFALFVTAEFFGIYTNNMMIVVAGSFCALICLGLLLMVTEE